jgi:predicted alpha/beta-hydrolase family hydrolase
MTDPSGSTARRTRAKKLAVLLFPGAGSSSENPSLRAIEDALAPIPVQRSDFPYRKAGRRAPDKPAVLLEAVRAEHAALAARTGVAPTRIVLGGRSMGGRMCSMAVAGDEEHDPIPAAGLVLISYPLHPPGRPDQLRIAHLPSLAVPCLFVHGTKDPFATADELRAHTAVIKGPVTHEWIDGGRHDLKGADRRIATIVAEWVRALRA